MPEHAAYARYTLLALKVALKLKWSLYSLGIRYAPLLPRHQCRISIQRSPAILFVLVQLVQHRKGKVARSAME